MYKLLQAHCSECNYFFIQCTLNGFIKYISAEFQRGRNIAGSLTQLEVKILFDDFTYFDDDDYTEAVTMIDVVYEVDSDDD